MAFAPCKSLSDLVSVDRLLVFLFLTPFLRGSIRCSLSDRPAPGVYPGVRFALRTICLPQRSLPELTTPTRNSTYQYCHSTVLTTVGFPVSDPFSKGVDPTFFVGSGGFALCTFFLPKQSKFGPTTPKKLIHQNHSGFFRGWGTNKWVTLLP